MNIYICAYLIFHGKDLRSSSLAELLVPTRRAWVDRSIATDATAFLQGKTGEEAMERACAQLLERTKGHATDFGTHSTFGLDCKSTGPNRHFVRTLTKVSQQPWGADFIGVRACLAERMY